MERPPSCAHLVKSDQCQPCAMYSPELTFLQWPPSADRVSYPLLTAPVSGPSTWFPAHGRTDCAARTTQVVFELAPVVSST